MTGATGSTWGASHFELSGLNFKTHTSNNTLYHAVEILPARVKQAFYGAAIRKGVIKRSSWNGCAFNEGGIEIGNETVKSIPAAARAFGVSEFLVKNFIQKWDSSPYPSDSEATQALIGILEKVGIFSEPDKPTVRIINETVYTGNLTDQELTQEFVDAIKLDNLDAELAALLDAAESVLV